MLDSTEMDDHSSEASETTPDGLPLTGERRIIEEVFADSNESPSTEPVKITTHEDKVVDSVVSTSQNGSMALTAEIIQEPPLDAASIHSLPVVRVTEPQSPTRQSLIVGSDGDSLTNVRPESPQSVSTSRPSTPGRPLTPNERRQRHRSGVEVRVCSVNLLYPDVDPRIIRHSFSKFRPPNRFSGFISNLIARRDQSPSTAPPSPSIARVSNTAELNSARAADPPARSDSPLSSFMAPPPSLPAPTLQELGLSLSVVTSDLSPSHFSTSPSSGAFLAPHYLLLCHAQGLDVLPLQSPPAPQPYALVRRVSFKSVVVMEERGVLVAIAGRRDGVRVYALDEIKKAVEWRIEVEIRRDRDRMRREASKKIFSSPLGMDVQEGSDKKANGRPSTPASSRSKLSRRLSQVSIRKLPTPTPVQGVSP